MKYQRLAIAAMCCPPLGPRQSLCAERGIRPGSRINDLQGQFGNLYSNIIEKWRMSIFGVTRDPRKDCKSGKHRHRTGTGQPAIYEPRVTDLPMSIAFPKTRNRKGRVSVRYFASGCPCISESSSNAHCQAPLAGICRMQRPALCIFWN